MNILNNSSNSLFSSLSFSLLSLIWKKKKKKAYVFLLLKKMLATFAKTYF